MGSEIKYGLVNKMSHFCTVLQPINEFISQQTLTATLCVLRGCIFVYAYENHSWALHYLDS